MAGRVWMLLVACAFLSPMLYTTMSAFTLPEGSPVVSCTRHFTLHNNFCYRYFGADARKAFHHAQKQCSRFQSALVSLHSVEEEQFVMGLATNQSAFWIGLNDEAGPGQTHKEGHFRWSSGEKFNNPSSYCRWKKGEPINRRHLDCVKVDSEGWALAPGGCAATKLPFVCKKRACPLDMCADNVSESEVSSGVALPGHVLMLLACVCLLLAVVLMVTLSLHFSCTAVFGTHPSTSLPLSHEELEAPHRTKPLPQDLYPT